MSAKQVWREWWHLITLGSFLLLFLVGFRWWADWKANQPIVVEYQRYVEFLEHRSPKAQAYLQRYFSTYQRDTVASRHFEHICAAMTGLASEEGFTLAEYPDFPSLWCKEKSAYHSEILLP